MKVAIALWGRFHAFKLAEGLAKTGELSRLITSHPSFMAVRDGIPANLVSGHLLLTAYQQFFPQALRRYAPFLPSNRRIMYELFPRLAASKIPSCTDILIAFPGCAKETFKRAKQIGALCVIDRGSSHPAFCAQILNEEHALYDLSGSPAPRSETYDREPYDAADYVLIPSGFVERTFLQQGFDRKRLIRVPYGVDLDVFSPKPAHQNDTTFRIVYAGQMSLRKGVHYLLQAFSELSLPNSELLLVGPTRHDIIPHFNKYAGTFTYHKAVPQHELPKYYRKGSVFVICSVEEGLALVQPQAMACGLPVICTTNTGGEDLVRDGLDGYVIPIRDVDTLKDRIQRLYLDRDLCRAMGQSAAARAKSFSWSTYAKKVSDELHARLGVHRRNTNSVNHAS